MQVPAHRNFIRSLGSLFRDDGGDGSVKSHCCGNFSTNKLLPPAHWHQWILDSEAVLLSRLESIASPSRSDDIVQRRGCLSGERFLDHFSF